MLGAQNFVDGRNPISLCNVLFVGNLCALMVLSLLHWQRWNRSTLRKISQREWFSLIIVALLAGALAPSLIFQALALTRVNNVILVGRLEPPLTLALSIWLLREPVNRWEVMGAIAAFVGVALTILLPSNMSPMGGFGVGSGELLAAAGAIALAIAAIMGKQQLSKVPLGIYTVTRTALGTLIFFVIALVLYGSDHFMDAFSPFLWQWMLVYGVIIVVLGQSFWIIGTRASSVSTAAVIGSFTPIAGLLAAYLILGETPTRAQLIGGSLILLGIGLGQIGIQSQRSSKPVMPKVGTIQAEQEIEAGIGFQGM